MRCQRITCAECGTDVGKLGQKCPKCGSTHNGKYCKGSIVNIGWFNGCLSCSREVKINGKSMGDRGFPVINKNPIHLERLKDDSVLPVISTLLT